MMTKKEILDMVRTDGMALKDIPLKDLDSEICLAAVKNNWHAAGYVPVEMYTDEIYDLAMTGQQEEEAERKEAWNAMQEEEQETLRMLL